MKNCVVFRVGVERFAIELKWVREIISIGHVTAVPCSAPVLLGATQLHGTILPLLSAAHVVGQPQSTTSPNVGVVVQRDDTTLILAISAVEEVATLRGHDNPAQDAHGNQVQLLDPEHLIGAAHQAISAEHPL